MDKPNEQFTPEQVDEQIVRLLRNQPGTLPAASFIQEVHRHYQQERQTLEGAWERLSKALDEREHSATQQSNFLQPSPSQPVLSGVERAYSRKQPAPGKPGLMKRLLPFAAVLLVVLLISSFVLTFSLMNRARAGITSNITPLGASGSSSKPVKTGVDLTEGLRLHMVTESIGWAIGSSANGNNWASILRTTDGGLHWKQVTPSQAASQGISELYILDETTAWVPGSGGTWYRTTDGGATWKPLGWLQGQIRPFSFSDPDHGWMIVSSFSGDKSQPPPTAPAQPGSLLYTTSNGGDTWQRQSNTLPFSFVREFHTITQQTAWVTTEGLTLNSQANVQAVLYVTHDAGHTWEPRQLPRPTGITRDVPSLTFGPTFVTEQDGSIFAAFGQDATHDMYLYVTHDGGKSWQVQGSAIPGYVGVRSVVDDQHIIVDSGFVAAGLQMDIMTLTNGQWRQLGTHPTKGDPVEYSFPSASTGVALVSTQSNSLDVYQTHDVGKTWQKIATLPTVS